jgi:WD40 repeat protein
LLPNGQVLVAGGFNGDILSSAELYDPASGTWTATGSLVTARTSHTATLLPNGMVLVVGGVGESDSILESAELYDPASGTWTPTGSLNIARELHTATLLPNGKVLVAAGAGNAVNLASTELYDPASGAWTATGSLATARFDHTATLLPNGQVLVAGGNDGVSLKSAELYDPASGIWSATGNLKAAHEQHTATLLPNGKVLVAGGIANNHTLASAELYDVGLGFSNAWQPRITVAKVGKSLQLTGSRFQGISQASGGNTQDSSSNYPIVQLRSIDNSQVVFLLVDPVRGWSDTSFRSIAVRNFPLGPALVTVFTNGILSNAKYLVVPQGP